MISRKQDMRAKVSETYDADAEALLNLDLSQYPKEVEFFHSVKLNIALCSLKMGEFKECIQVCDEILAFDSKSIKAWYRRAMAFKFLHEPHLALYDLQNALQISPHDSLCLQEIRYVQRQIEREEKNEKRVSSKIFG